MLGVFPPLRHHTTPARAVWWLLEEVDARLVACPCGHSSEETAPAGG